ncbi:MAG: ATP12 family chaperone protein [Micavibrio sp.]
MKRFYTLVTTRKDGNGYLILLDGKPIKTPDGRLVSVPTETLAGHVVQEWARQSEVIDSETMPLTQILVTAQGRGEKDRPDIEKTILGYLDTDLLCYRAELPAALVARQSASWDPWLKWFEAQSGVTLLTTPGLSALVQPKAAHDYTTRVVKAADQWHFTVIQMVTAVTGSIVLGMAFAAGAATPDNVFQAAQVEELYRSELYNEPLYGPDPHQEKTQNGLLRDLNALRLFLDSIRI